MTESRGIRVRRGTRIRWAAEQQGKHLCECGCGELIPVIPQHFPNVPRFLHGHNIRVAPLRPRKELPPRQPCECGCGDLAGPGKRFISGHNSLGRKISDEMRRKLAEANTGERSHRYGKRATNWKGGRIVTNHGYVHIWSPDHPNAQNGRYVPEHRLIAEEHLRTTDPGSRFLVNGYLHRGADVHHINGRKDDNRIENLDVMWRSEHTRLHAPHNNMKRHGKLPS